jgi:hypothetical protein
MSKISGEVSTWQTGTFPCKSVFLQNTTDTTGQRPNVIFSTETKDLWTGVAQSVQCLTTDWTTEVRYPTKAERPDLLWVPPSLSPMGTGSPFPGGKARPGRHAEHSPHLVPRLRMSRSYTSSHPEWSGTALLKTKSPDEFLYVVLGILTQKASFSVRSRRWPQEEEGHLFQRGPSRPQLATCYPISSGLQERRRLLFGGPVVDSSDLRIDVMTKSLRWWCELGTCPGFHFRYRNWTLRSVLAKISKLLCYWHRPRPIFWFLRQRGRQIGLRALNNRLICISVSLFTGIKVPHSKYFLTGDIYNFRWAGYVACMWEMRNRYIGI